MNIATSNVIAKVAAAVAGFGLVAVSFAPIAQADANSDLQAQIQALLAQVASLQSQLGGSQSASMTFSTNLTVGSKGADVTALQNWLISKGYSVPAGATGFFGAQTKAAVAAWQAAAGISPASGFFGPISRAKVNAMGGSTTGGTTTGGTSTGGLTGGEATLSNFDLVSESGDLRQGVSGSQLASAKFDVKGSDINVQRADFEFQATNNSLDTHPWKYIKTVSLWDGSKKLASMDASTQDAWDDTASDTDHSAGASKYYKVSFTGLNDVIKNNTTGNRLTLAVDTQSSIDTANASQTFKVDVPDQGIRAIDAAGINEYTGGVSDKVTVSVSTAQNGKLTVSEDSSDPLAGVLVADTTNTTGDLNVFAFNVKNTQSQASTITDLTFNVATSSASGSSAKDVTSIVRKATLNIGGQKYDGTINASTIVFNDINANVPGNGSTVGTVTVQLFGQTSHFAATGESLKFSLASTNVTAQNANTGDNVTSSNITGTATGNTQIIGVTGGINAVGGSNTAVLTYNSNTPASSFGTFTLNFSVSANGTDVYVPASIALDSASSTYAGVVVVSNLQGSTTSSTVTGSLSSSAKTSGTYGMYKIAAGTTETFTATVTIDPTGTNFYQVGLDKIKFSTTNDLQGLQTLDVDQTQSQFKTSAISVPNS